MYVRRKVFSMNENVENEEFFDEVLFSESYDSFMNGYNFAVEKIFAKDEEGMSTATKVALGTGAAGLVAGAGVLARKKGWLGKAKEALTHAQADAEKEAYKTASGAAERGGSHNPIDYAKKITSAMTKGGAFNDAKGKVNKDLQKQTMEEIQRVTGDVKNLESLTTQWQNEKNPTLKAALAKRIEEAEKAKATMKSNNKALKKIQKERKGDRAGQNSSILISKDGRDLSLKGFMKSKEYKKLKAEGKLTGDSYNNWVQANERDGMRAFSDLDGLNY